MAATALNIVWRNPLPIWARPAEQLAGPLELVKTPEPPAPVSLFLQRRNGCAHVEKRQEPAGLASSAVVTAIDSCERRTR